MTFRPFNLLYDSGSDFKVVDPTTNNENSFYLISASGATSESWFWDSGDYSGNILFKSIVWAGFLNKFVLLTDDMSYTSTDGIAWISGSNVLDDPTNPFLSGFRGIVVGNDLNKVVANRSGWSSRPMAYSTDGLNWNSATASAEMNARGITYSPTLQRFVSVGWSDVFEVRVAYSDNGTNFTVISGSSNISSASNIQEFSDVTWDASSSKFIAVGRYLNSGANYYSASIHTSSNGINWNVQSIVSASTDFYDAYFYKILAVSGSYIIVGDNPNNITPSRAILRSNNLVNWNYISDLPTRDLYDITYSPIHNRFVAVGEYTSFAQNKTIIYSSNGTTWNSSSFSTYTFPHSIHAIVWSPVLNKFVAIGTSETYYSYDGVKFFTKNESYTGSIGFTSTPAGTILNTPLTPWTSSVTTTFGTDTGAATSIEFNLMVGPDPTTDVQYVPTSSYGIIIDSASLVQFYNTSIGSYMEDVEVDGVRYLREITQEEGNEYAKYNDGYYETDTFTLRNKDISEFSASLKASGRNYLLMYYTVSGNDVGDNVAVILNLGNGTVEYYEDASNYDAPGSYNLSGGAYNDMRFIQIPTLTDKTNGYWGLTFSVGFRVDTQRSGSLTIT